MLIMFMYISHFRLRVIYRGRLYVLGLWPTGPSLMITLMVFNPSQNCYECTMLLKQGWYNYEFVSITGKDSNGEASVFEGSHMRQKM